MKRKKPIIVALLFLINIIMLIVAVIPHHHHSDGMICMKQDLPVEQQCPAHHHPENDSCCSNECMTRFHSRTPSVQPDSGPDYVFIATLFTDFIIEQLLRPQERRIKHYYIYHDPLHGTDIHRAIPLRAPPYTVFA